MKRYCWRSTRIHVISLDLFRSCDQYHVLADMYFLGLIPSLALSILLATGQCTRTISSVFGPFLGCTSTSGPELTNGLEYILKYNYEPEKTSIRTQVLPFSLSQIVCLRKWV